MIKQSKDEIIFKIIGYIFIILIALFCLLPFILIISASLTEESAIFKYGYNFIPNKFSLEAYEILLKVPLEIIRSFGITIIVVTIGTSLSLFLSSMCAYTLSNKSFKYRNKFSFVIYITSIFSGGLIPLYILMVRYLHLKNTLPALILPLLLSAWNIFLLRRFIGEIPPSLLESAKIDGANEFTIYFRIVLPLSIPAMTTIGFFQALYYWNDWMQAYLYVNDKSLYPIQYYLYQMLNSFQAINSAIFSSGVSIPRIPTESIKMAITVIAIIPTVILFPFIQRFFVKGLTAGAIKG
jgi:putative aldouronate transport system permease protein